MAELTLTVAEAVEATGIGKNTMYQLVHTEGFPRIHVGTKILIPKSSLEDWLRKKAEEGATI